MAYRLKCHICGRTFTGVYQNSHCPSYGCGNRSIQLLDDVLDVAVGVAVGYATGSLIESGVSAAADVVGSIFDW